MNKKNQEPQEYQHANPLSIKAYNILNCYYFKIIPVYTHPC